MASTLLSGPGVFAPLAVVLHLRYGLSAAGHGLAEDLRTGDRRVVHLLEMGPIWRQPKTFDRQFFNHASMRTQQLFSTGSRRMMFTADTQINEWLQLIRAEYLEMPGPASDEAADRTALGTRSSQV